MASPLPIPAATPHPQDSSNAAQAPAPNSPPAAAQARKENGSALAATQPRPSKKRRLVLALSFGALVLAASGYWFSQRGLEHTDDAQLDADVVAVPSRAAGTVVAVHFTDNMRVSAGDLLFELDAAQTQAKLAEAEAEVLAAEAASSAAEATAELTRRNAAAGKTIARASLSGAAAQATASSDQVAELNASLAAARAVRDKANSDFERAQTLVQSGALASAELETARANLDNAHGVFDQAAARIVTLKSSTSQAQARVSEAAARLGQANDTAPAQVAEAEARAAAAHARIATAQAARELARLNLSYTKIYAPRAGVVSKRSVALGQLVSAGQTVVIVIPEIQQGGEVWVTGNFKETQLAHMHVGQPATLTVDAYGREIRGHVESFSGATGARFALLPPDNATGNFTKVVQRVPVRVKLDDPPADLLLIPGLSVELTVNTRL